MAKLKANMQLNRNLQGKIDTKYEVFMQIASAIFFPLTFLVLLSGKSKNPKMFVFIGFVVILIIIITLGYFINQPPK